jgi:tetraacyldisaccharide 4'-kinase
MNLLFPFSLIYSILSKINRCLSKQKRLSKPVISVGNLTVGGTGKTPMVMEILNFIIKNNLSPAVLTRGYLRKSKIPILLKDGAIGVDVLDSGDEPLLIAKSVRKATVIIGSDRYRNALKFEGEINPDVYILDDGFQHWHIKRDLDIVCVNAANPFGNGFLIPAGILREKPSALARAGLIIITNADMISEQELERLKETIYALSGKKSIVTYYNCFEYKTIDLTMDFNVELLKRFDVYSLSAICFAAGFNNSIEKSGIKIKDSIVLRDHSNYTNEKLKKIISQKGRNSYFIVTAKDAVKFQNIDENIKEKFAVLTAKLQFMTGKKQWEEELLKCLRSF